MHGLDCMRRIQYIMLLRRRLYLIVLVVKGRANFVLDLEEM